MSQVSLLTNRAPSYDPFSGGGIGDWIEKGTQLLKKANHFAQRTRVASKVTGIVGDVTGNQAWKDTSSWLAKRGYNINGGALMPVAVASPPTAVAIVRKKKYKKKPGRKRKVGRPKGS
jgi:hypothetical protein